MKSTLRIEFDDSQFPDTPTLGEMLDALTKMHDSGAPRDAVITPTMGDKGTQRDPWPYVRGLSASWEA